MKTLIAVPCMDLIPVPFITSLLQLDLSGHEVSYDFHAGSLIYDSRNQLLERAKEMQAERILWLDSDMVVPPDALQRLEADLRNGCDIVSGLYFGRRPPSQAVIYSDCDIVKLADDQILPLATRFLDYPRDELFEVQGFGFGCVLMRMSAVARIRDEMGLYPFMPPGGFGEDLSFCIRARKSGVKLWCDSRVLCGHIGHKTYTQDDWKGE